MLWATLQLASHGVSAIADGKFASENASQGVAHVESTTTASCPVVHSPDCAVCRFLSGSASENVASTVVVPRLVQVGMRDRGNWLPRTAARALPNGRAPPAI